MAKDVLITPLDGIIQFSSSAGAGTGQIKVDSDDLVISNLVGDVLLGDGASDVFIGNGSDNVDIVFEQNGEIRDDGSGKNITLGSKTTNVLISGSNTIALQKQGGNVGIGKTTATTTLEVEGDISGSGAINTLSHITASGNISSSGTTTTNALNVFGPAGGSGQIYINDADNGLGVSDGLLIQKSGQNAFIYNRDTGHLEIGTNNKQQLHIRDEAAEGQLKIADGGIDVTGHITASGNISGSSTSTIQVGGNITTPQTGSFGEINLGDDKEIRLGDSGDLRIFHDPNNSVIREDGGGDLFLQGSAIRIRENSDGGTIALFTDGAGTELRHDNVKKFETSDGGINVTGHITASGNISSSGGLKIEGGSFNLGGNTVTDAAIVLPEGQKIYTFEDGQYFRNLIHKASDVIQIGQSGTALVDEIRLLPGNAGFTTFYGNTTEVARIDMAGNITASGNISASGFVSASSFSGDGAGLTNITSVGTLSTLTVDDITINGSQISDGGNLTIISTGGDVIIGSDEKQIDLQDGDGNTRFSFKTDSTPEMDVTGNFTIDGSGLIKFNNGDITLTHSAGSQHLKLAGGNFNVDGHITASGNISSSGTITSNDAKIVSSVDGGNALLTISNTNTDTGTDKGAGIEFKHSNTNGEQIAGLIIAGKDTSYGAALGTAAQDSNLQFFTTLNGSNTEAFRIKSSNDLQFAGNFSMLDESGESFFVKDSNLKVSIGDPGGSANSTMLIVDDNNNKITMTGDAPQVVIGGTAPATNQELTVVGEVSASSTITSKTGFVGETQTTGSYDFPGAIMGYNVQGLNVGHSSVNLTTSLAVIDSSLNICFVAPKSGIVEIEVQFYYDLGFSSGTALTIGLSDNATYNAVQSYYEQLVGDPDENDDLGITHKWVVNGLTPGTTYKYWFGGKVLSTSGTPKIAWGGNASGRFKDFIMKATALPSNTEIET
jgi:hypothetical protein